MIRNLKKLLTVFRFLIWLPLRILAPLTRKEFWGLLVVCLLIGAFIAVAMIQLGLTEKYPILDSVVATAIIITLFGFPYFVGWRLTRSPRAFGDLGSAKFETKFKDISRKKKLFFQEGKRFQGNQRVILAQCPNKKNEFLSIKTGHLLCIAPTRSGKGVSSIIPNLLTMKTSVFCLDIKGENYAVTATRNAFSKICLIDIFGQTGHESAIINPLAGIDPFSPEGQRKVNGIVDALVLSESSVADPHWDESAKQLLRTITLLVLIKIPNTTLVHVRDFLFLGIDNLLDRLEPYQNSDISFIRNGVNSVLSKSEREFSSILSTAQRHLEFLQDLSVQNYFSKPGDTSFANMAKSVCSYYLVIPPDLLQFSKRIIRMMIDLALFENMTTAPKDVVFFLDEFAQVGRMERLEQAVTLAAGYGIRLLMYVQDIAQLKQNYQQKWSSFVANSTVQFFGVNDFETAKYISDMLGTQTIQVSSASRSDSRNQEMKHTMGRSENMSVTRRNLLNPDEIINLPSHLTIILTQGKLPIVATKTSYFERVFAKKYYANPFYGN